MTEQQRFLSNALEATIRIGALILVAAWCFDIVKPFIIPIVWGIIIAVAIYPGFLRLQKALGGRNGLAAALVTLLGLFILITPMIMLSGTLIGSAQGLARGFQEGTIVVPPPPESVKGWPVVGEHLDAFWLQASQNLAAAAAKIAPQLKAVGSFLLSTAAGASFGILQFVIAIVIAGVLLARAKAGTRAAYAIANRLAGEKGSDLADLAEATVRSVTRGILGVSLIQSLLAGLGFIAMGIPGAGLWALLCLLLSVVQIGIFPITIPILIYVFSTADTLPAVLFLVWSIFVATLDNILKPVLLGRGVQVPMAVIFIGAIGGFISEGIIGLFVGSVVLVLGYKLFLAWLDEPTGVQPRASQTGADRQGEAAKA
jgi:predicted PurR-regulated permease PerM